jgi:hypothetical protein
MSSLVKSTLLSVSLLAVAAVTAHAQSGSVAALPPGATAAPPAVTAINPYPGPNPGAGYYGGTVSQQQAVAPSPQYVGPSPGAGTGIVAPPYSKSADYDTNPAMHPYSNPTTSQTGPRPN